MFDEQEAPGLAELHLAHGFGDGGKRKVNAEHADKLTVLIQNLGGRGNHHIALDGLVGFAQHGGLGAVGAIDEPGAGGHVRSGRNRRFIKGHGVAAVLVADEHFLVVGIGPLHVLQFDSDFLGLGAKIGSLVDRILSGVLEVGELSQTGLDLGRLGQAIGRKGRAVDHLIDIMAEKFQLLLRFERKILNGGLAHFPDGNTGDAARHDEQRNDETQQNTSLD